MSAAPSSPETLFFITGAPRTGTTFVSDWICEAPGAYCAHEVAREVRGVDGDGIMAHLRACARTGRDRLEKPLQREFLRWEHPRTEDAPRVLGFKEPLTWNVAAPGAYAVDGFLRERGARCVVLVRHPYDMVASGLDRAARTRNWPGFSVEEHCRLWAGALELADALRRDGLAVLRIRFEELLLAYDEVRARLGAFLGVELPGFAGHERTREYLDRLRNGASLARGVPNGPNRAYLTDEHRDTIRALAAAGCERLSYVL